MKITELSLMALTEALQKKEVSAQEAAEAYLAKIATTDPDVGAYLSVEAAVAAAKQVDERRASGEVLPRLAGVPCGIKDNICTRGMTTTCASKMLEHFMPPYDATVMEKLNAQHVVVLGKLNMDEFAMGSSTENSYFQITHNPRDLSRVPGGGRRGGLCAGL